MLAMLDALAKSGHQGQVNWFHAAENGDVHAFADEVKALGAALPAFTSHVWYRTPTEADRQAGRFDSEGLMDLAAVADNIRDPQMQYLCGPVAFMQFAAKQLVELGSTKTTFITNASARIRCCKPDDAGSVGRVSAAPPGNTAASVKSPRRLLRRYEYE